MTQLDLDPSVLLRVIKSAVAAELRDGCGRRIDPVEAASWSAQTALDESGIDLDSLEILSAAGRINELFHMHESGVEDYLLRDRTLGRWADILRASLERASERLTFLTSGSTGQPKPCTHRVEDLWQEIDAFAPLFEGRRRLIACVPCHHIYGFLFTILLPERLDIPVVEGSGIGPSQWAGLLQEGDLIISSPSFWNYLVKTVPTFGADIEGTTSTAPMPRALSRSLMNNGLSRLVEIYGASETAGIGWRTDPDGAYTLLPHWRTDGQGQLIRETHAAADQHGSMAQTRCAAPVEPMDMLIWEPPTGSEKRGPRRFRPAGRRDNAVQVGGTNIFPGRIASVIADHALVDRCSVNLAQDEGLDRLKAHIVLAEGAVPSAAIVRTLEDWCKERLSVHERPRVLSFTSQLPGEMPGGLAEEAQDGMGLRAAAG